ncbi:unnamed protein product, partial [Coccothraustes coccothraustes]
RRSRRAGRQAGAEPGRHLSPTPAALQPSPRPAPPPPPARRGAARAARGGRAGEPPPGSAPPRALSQPPPAKPARRQRPSVSTSLPSPRALGTRRHRRGSLAAGTRDTPASCLGPTGAPPLPTVTPGVAGADGKSRRAPHRLPSVSVRAGVMRGPGCADCGMEVPEEESFPALRAAPSPGRHGDAAGAAATGVAGTGSPSGR